MFSQAAIEQLKYYVYFLQDPTNGEVFYVGKGKGNRVFQHLECAIETDGSTEKLDRIRTIISSGKEVRHYILRHGLSEEDSFEIEAAMVDFLGLSKLSNIMGGHYSSDFGIKTADEIEAMYRPEELRTSIPLMLFNLNRLYRRDMTERELYKATRQSWVAGGRRQRAQYAIACYCGLTREVYEIHRWFPVDCGGRTRWGFDGQKASDDIQRELRYKNIDYLFGRGAANPVRYMNC